MNEKNGMTRKWVQNGDDWKEQKVRKNVRNALMGSWFIICSTSFCWIEKFTETLGEKNKMKEITKENTWREVGKRWDRKKSS